MWWEKPSPGGKEADWDQWDNQDGWEKQGRLDGRTVLAVRESIQKALHLSLPDTFFFHFSFLLSVLWMPTHGQLGFIVFEEASLRVYICYFTRRL